MNLGELLNAPVMLRKLVRALVVDADQLERGAARQPQLYLEAARYRVQLMRKRARAQVKLQLAQAVAGLEYRREKDSSGKKKHSEAAVKEMIARHSKVRKAQRRLDRMYEFEEFGKQLVEAFRQRVSVLKIVSDIRNSEMNSEVRAVRSRMAGESHGKKARKIADRYNELHKEEDDE